MGIVIPQYSKRSAYEIWHKTGNKSHTLQYSARQVTEKGEGCDFTNILHADGANHFVHSFMILPMPMGNPYGTDMITHLGLSISINHVEDILAMEEVFAEMTATCKALEDGSLKGAVSKTISRRGVAYAFDLNVSANTLLFMLPGPDGKMIPHHGKAKPFTNSMHMYVMVGDEQIKIADFHFYGAMKSALLIAHDLAVLKAIINGVPEEVIAGMRPHELVDPTDPEDIVAMVMAKTEASKNNLH